MWTVAAVTQLCMVVSTKTLDFQCRHFTECKLYLNKVDFIKWCWGWRGSLWPEEHAGVPARWVMWYLVAHDHWNAVIASCCDAFYLWSLAEYHGRSCLPWTFLLPNGDHGKRSVLLLVYFQLNGDALLDQHSLLLIQCKEKLNGVFDPDDTWYKISAVVTCFTAITTTNFSG